MRLLSFKSKPEAVVSKDQTRPVLTHLYLRIEETEEGRKGTLEATDSYKLVRIPVEVEDDDTEGFIPVEVYKQARKVSSKTLGAVEVKANGSLDLQDGSSFPRTMEGQFPRTGELMNLAPSEFEIGLNARFLYDLAQAFGEDTVRIRFTGRDGGQPDALRPMTVRPLGGDADAILMPIRLAG